MNNSCSSFASLNNKVKTQHIVINNNSSWFFFNKYKIITDHTILITIFVSIFNAKSFWHEKIILEQLCKYSKGSFHKIYDYSWISSKKTNCIRSINIMLLKSLIKIFFNFYHFLFFLSNKKLLQLCRFDFTLDVV